MSEKTRFGVLIEAKKAEVHECSIPKLGDNQILVKQKACNICTTDYGQWMGLREHQPYPMAGGHEGAGVIVEKGNKVGNELKIGDHVAMAYDYCGECYPCKSGRTGECSQYNNAPTADDGGPYIGVAGVPVTFDGTGSTDPDGNALTYSWEFGDGETGTGSNPEHTYDSAGTYKVNLTVNDGLLTNTSSTTATISESATDSDGDGYKDEMEESYGTDANNDSDYPTDTDGDGIPDDDSPDGKYTGDTDDDNDGLDDETEEELGSKPKDGTDVTTIKIGENTYYLVDTDGDGEIDTIYNPQTGEDAEITVEDEKISIDTDGDGEADYSYDTVSGEVTEYKGEKKEKPEEFPLWLAILAIIIVVVVIILALIKTGYLYIEGEKPGKKK